MPGQTPIEIVEAMIARKERAKGRIETSIRENAATGGRLSAYDMATEATRLADAQGAIEVLREVLEEMQALAAAEGPGEQVQHDSKCRFYPLYIDRADPCPCV